MGKGFNHKTSVTDKVTLVKAFLYVLPYRNFDHEKTKKGKEEEGLTTLSLGSRTTAFEDHFDGSGFEERPPTADLMSSPFEAGKAGKGERNYS
jgi:hypothetical protein